MDVIERCRLTNKTSQRTGAAETPRVARRPTAAVADIRPFGRGTPRPSGPWGC